MAEDTAEQGKKTQTLELIPDDPKNTLVALWGGGIANHDDWGGNLRLPTDGLKPGDIVTLPIKDRTDGIGYYQVVYNPKYPSESFLQMGKVNERNQTNIIWERPREFGIVALTVPDVETLTEKIKAEGKPFPDIAITFK